MADYPSRKQRNAMAPLVIGMAIASSEARKAIPTAMPARPFCHEANNVLQDLLVNKTSTLVHWLAQEYSCQVSEGRGVSQSIYHAVAGSCEVQRITDLMSTLQHTLGVEQDGRTASQLAEALRAAADQLDGGGK